MEVRRPIYGGGDPLAGRSVRRRCAVVLRPRHRGRPARREPRGSGRTRREPPLHLRQPRPRTAQRPARRVPPGPDLLRGAARAARPGRRPARGAARRQTPGADDQRPDLGGRLQRPPVLARHLPPAGDRRGRVRADGDRRRDQRCGPAAGGAGGGPGPRHPPLHGRSEDRHHARHGHHLPGAGRVRRAALRRRGRRRRLPARRGASRTPCRARCPAVAAGRAAGPGAARRAGAAVRAPGGVRRLRGGLRRHPLPGRERAGPRRLGGPPARPLRLHLGADHRLPGPRPARGARRAAHRPRPSARHAHPGPGGGLSRLQRPGRGRRPGTRRPRRRRPRPRPPLRPRAQHRPRTPGLPALRTPRPPLARGDRHPLSPGRAGRPGGRRLVRRRTAPGRPPPQGDGRCDGPRRGGPPWR